MSNEVKMKMMSVVYTVMYNIKNNPHGSLYMLHSSQHTPKTNPEK